MRQRGECRRKEEDYDARFMEKSKTCYISTQVVVTLFQRQNTLNKVSKSLFSSKFVAGLSKIQIYIYMAVHRGQRAIGVGSRGGAETAGSARGITLQPEQ